MTDDSVFILINLYNPNTEKEQVSSWQKMNLILETFDDLEKKTIILGGDFSLYLDSLLEAEGGCPVLKKSSVSKLIEIKEKYNLCDIWRIRNTKELEIHFHKNITHVFCKEDKIIFLFQIPCRNQLKILKLYLCYVLITFQFCVL